MITQGRLKELLDYDPETGVFTWWANGRRHKAGDVAGCKTCKRPGGSFYWCIALDGRLYQNAGRLAWLYMTGAFPPQHIDHKNRNSLDNRWDNLRPANPGQNQANKGMRRDNTSGRTGVIFIPSKQKWRADLSVEGRNRCLGYFPEREQAYATYLQATIEHRGEFAAQI